MNKRKDSQARGFTSVELPVVSRRKRAAFTLVELLVVIAIIGILVALLLPAIQSAREAARRSQCTSNLKNLALAVINYQDVKKRFPMSENHDGAWPVRKVNLNTGANEIAPADPLMAAKKVSGTGWTVQILPFIEEQALFDQFKPYLDKPWYILKDSINADIPAVRQAIQVQPDVLVCPSDTEYKGPNPNQYPFNNTGSAGVENGPATVATTNYKGNAGDTSFAAVIPHTTPTGFWSGSPTPTVHNLDCHTAVDCVGIFWRYTYVRGGVKLREVTDGLSNTLLIGEASPVDGNSAAWSSDGDWAVTAIQLNWDFRTAGGCQGPEGFSPGANGCWPNMRGFRSNHPGGVNFALGDGSVTFISDDIEQMVYRALSSKAGDEVIGAY
jgi:prepilin-type N-terminal cleavage/methylation domain-containing protein/prepilin-type processing-associated H-X9-DG protein